MRVADNGQITIPKEILEKAGVGPGTDVVFEVQGGKVVMSKSSSPVRDGLTLENLRKWQEICQQQFAEMGYASVDEYLADVRGR